MCGEEPGAEGGLGIEATSFYCRRGFFFNFFFLRLIGVQVYFLVVSIILSQLGGFGCLQVTLSL